LDQYICLRWNAVGSLSRAKISTAVKCLAGFQRSTSLRGTNHSCPVSAEEQDRAYDYKIVIYFLYTTVRLFSK
jgi:hypothetical protein